MAVLERIKSLFKRPKAKAEVKPLEPAAKAGVERC